MLRAQMTSPRQPNSTARATQARTSASPALRLWAGGRAGGSTASIRNSASPVDDSSTYGVSGNTNSTEPITSPVASSSSPARARVGTPASAGS
jgi:hypothetical protein